MLRVLTSSHPSWASLFAMAFGVGSPCFSPPYVNTHITESKSHQTWRFRYSHSCSLRLIQAAPAVLGTRDPSIAQAARCITSLLYPILYASCVRRWHVRCYSCANKKANVLEDTPVKRDYKPEGYSSVAAYMM